MKKIISMLLLILISQILTVKTYAIANPLDKPNNKIGIHILFPTELPDAAKMINGNGGDWGYVVIPIQAGDKDVYKWQQFMNSAAKLHVIPILRLSTEDDYFNTTVWRKPNYLDVVDFANFLHTLSWPVKNKYIVIFNEPNRGDEWGGKTDPADYAQLLSFAVNTFKSKDPDFFIISAGLDNAAANNGQTAMDEFDYMHAMNNAVPGIFYQIDGLASHSYPNPAFSSSPEKKDGESIASFYFEKQIAKNLGSHDLPVFITETGWSNQNLSESTIASYYITAFNTVWNDPSIVAVTPFLLKAGGDPFSHFSFLLDNGNESKKYTTLKNLPKTKGAPILDTKSVLGTSTMKNKILPVKEFFNIENRQSSVFSVPQNIKTAIKWLLKV